MNSSSDPCMQQQQLKVTEIEDSRERDEDLSPDHG